MNEETINLAEKLAQHFLKSEFKKVSDDEDESIQFECAGYYFTANKEKVNCDVIAIEELPWTIEVEISSSYSYMEPPDSDIVEIGHEKDLIKAIMFAAKTDLQVAMDGFCEGEYFEQMQKTMDEGF
jgi:chloramphenicol O-acetyltransferase